MWRMVLHCNKPWQILIVDIEKEVKQLHSYKSNESSNTTFQKSCEQR